jgi:hypothetical protein
MPGMARVISVIRPSATTVARSGAGDGAASLSELAVHGAKNASNCRFGVLIQPHISLLDACEIIVCQSAGQGMIVQCPEWRA